MTGLWCAEALLPGGWRRDVRLAWAGGWLTEVASAPVPRPGDAIAAVAVPGIANLHGHAFQRGMAGRAERAGSPRAGGGPDSFWSWRETMYRFALALEPDDLEAVAAMLYVEMLEAGFTRAGEFHYLHHDRDGTPYAAADELCQRLAAASVASGIGLTLLPVLYQHAGFGALPPEPAQRRFVCTADQFAGLLDAARGTMRDVPGGVVGLAPHSLRAVAPEALAAIPALAAGGPIHIHVAEQRREVEQCLAWSGARPVAWLLEHAQVDAGWCLIHATHADAAERAGIAARGAVVGLCPMTEASLGDGIFPATDFDGRWGVGTDSHVSVGLADELRLLEYGQRLRDGTRNALARPGGSTGRALFEAALAGGAQACGTGPAGFVVGAWADIVTLDASHPSLVGVSGDGWLDVWVFAAGNAAIDSVWARGERVVAGGRHVAREAIVRRYGATMRRLLDL